MRPFEFIHFEWDIRRIFPVIRSISASAVPPMTIHPLSFGIILPIEESDQLQPSKMELVESKRTAREDA